MAVQTLAVPRPSARPDIRESLRLAAIDVGSNSIHMIVAQADGDGGVTTLWRLKEPVGLGRLSFPSRRLTSEAMDRAVAVLGRFQREARAHSAEKTIAVATSAIREAENGGDLIERVRRELSLQIRVISAREEARLIYLAVRHAINLGDHPHLIIDIGGGSVEFIMGDAKRATLLESRKLGAARMTAQYIKSDPISEEDHRALVKHYDREIAPLLSEIAGAHPVRTIGTSGTLENLAAMCQQGSTGSDGDALKVIERAPFEKMLSGLLKSKSRDRARMDGLDDQRKDQIVAGAVLVDEILRRLEIERIEICPSALREGILLEYLSRHLPDLAIRRELPDPRRRSIIDLARRANWYRTHSEQVADLCMKLFDALQPLHHLGLADRELIEYGALLHDIGFHIGRNRHHKHSMYLILHGDLRDFTPQEIQVVANIARYHRRAAPRKKHEAYASLPASLRRVVDVGAALLRVADGLDRSHSSVIQDVRVKIEPRRIRLILTAKSDAELEIWGARRKMAWFEEVFDRKLVFELAKK